MYCIQTELRKVIQCMCVTLSSKVDRYGHVIFLNICYILNLENVRHHDRVCIMFATEDKKGHTKDCLTLIYLQGHSITIEFCHYHRWILWPREHFYKKYFRKMRKEKQKSRWVVLSPLGRFRFANYLVRLRVNQQLLYKSQGLFEFFNFIKLALYSV